MKVTSAALLATLGSTAVLASDQFVSRVFQLVVHSSSSQFDNTLLDACHIGAGIEALCATKGKVGSTSISNYTLAHSNGVPASSDGILGTLRYPLHYIGAGNKPGVEQEPFYLYQDPSTNVALGTFFPTDQPTEVAFDSAGHMNMQSGLKDTVTPPTDGQAVPYYRWYICTTNFEGYVYQTLNWVYGKYPPENPSCVAATIERVFL